MCHRCAEISSSVPVDTATTSKRLHNGAVIVRTLTTPADLVRYEAWLRGHPEGTLWQSLDWKRYQEALGRKTRLYVVEDERGAITASALVIVDRTTMGFCTWDIPRGPLQAMSDERSAVSTLLGHIVADAQHDRCMTLYLSPFSSLKAHSSQLTASSRHEQPSATRIIDLTLSDEQILAQMHPKGRYNIAVAKKHGVRVEASQDIDAFSVLLRETAARDRFIVGSTLRYASFFRELPGSFLLLAYEAISDQRLAVSTKEHSSHRLLQAASYEHTSSKLKAQSSKPPIGGLMGLVYRTTGIYYYGASSYAYRALMAPSLLQFEAMRLCRARGARSYDLLGVVAGPRAAGHPWEGISAFKAKFGGQVITYPPEQQIVLRPIVRALLTMKRRVLG